MVHLTPEQLRAMFSKGEISRGISSKDIVKRKKEFGLVKTPIVAPREQFRKEFGEGAKIVEPGKILISQEQRDAMLPPTHEIIKSGERKGELIRKRKFGISRPTEEASEAQKDAIQRLRQQEIPSARNLSIIGLISSGKINTMTFKQLTDEQKQQFEVLRNQNPARHKQILARLRANEIPAPTSQLTRGEASKILDQAKRERFQQVVSGLAGEKPDDPAAQAMILGLTVGQRNAAVEELQSFAVRKGKTSPRELSPGQIRFVLLSVKNRFTREGIPKLQ